MNNKNLSQLARFLQINDWSDTFELTGSFLEGGNEAIDIEAEIKFDTEIVEFISNIQSSGQGRPDSFSS